jgi:hypothetical protein
MTREEYDEYLRNIMRTLAVAHGRCKEQREGKCIYPECNCLFGEHGPINPVTGKGYEEEE